MTPGLRRMVGAGVELAATVVAAGLLGFWIDKKFETTPIWLIVGIVLGVVGGMYNMIRQTVQELFPNKDRNEGGGNDAGKRN